MSDGDKHGNGSDIDARIRQRLDDIAPLLLDLSHRIHAHPELRFAEHRAAGWLCAALEEAGFAVERGAGGLDTAFKAAAEAGAGPTIALLCEYDALEGLGHACGHNLIATMSLGAGLLLKPLLGQLGGRVVVLGTPGEEGGGGKVVLLERGVFDDIDVALMIHPSFETLAGTTSLARVAWQVRYRGRPAHAAAAPHLGINALDAVRLAFSGMDALRQQVTPDVRMHAIITEGGEAPNIIPQQAALKVYLRAATRETLYDSLAPRMRGVFEGAALMTGAEVSIEEIAKPYENMIVNEALAAAFTRHAERRGYSVGTPGPGRGTGSTDAGNVSQRLPCLHAYLRIDPSARPHTEAFATAAASPAGDRALLDGAAILAGIGAELLHDASLLDEVRRGTPPGPSAKATDPA